MTDVRPALVLYTHYLFQQVTYLVYCNVSVKNCQVTRTEILYVPLSCDDSSSTTIIHISDTPFRRWGHQNLQS